MGHIGNGRSYAAEMGAAPNLDAVSDFQALVTEYYSAASVATDSSGPRRVYPLQSGIYQIEFLTPPPDIYNAELGPQRWRIKVYNIEFGVGKRDNFASGDFSRGHNPFSGDPGLVYYHFSSDLRVTMQDLYNNVPWTRDAANVELVTRAGGNPIPTRFSLDENQDVTIRATVNYIGFQAVGRRGSPRFVHASLPLMIREQGNDGLEAKLSSVSPIGSRGVHGWRLHALSHRMMYLVFRNVAATRC